MVRWERLVPATPDQLVLRSLSFSRSRMIGFQNINTGLRGWFCCAAIGTGLLCGAAFGAEPALQPPGSVEILSLTEDEATALFLKRNPDLLIAQYGIESVRGIEVNDRVVPNPTWSVDASMSTP